MSKLFLSDLQIPELFSLGLCVCSPDSPRNPAGPHRQNGSPTSEFPEGPILWVLDQTQLPHKEIWNPILTVEQMVEQIHALRIRGAPLIGVGAALAFALTCLHQRPKRKKALEWLNDLAESRPTAVNLRNALGRLAPILGVGSDFKTGISTAPRVGPTQLYDDVSDSSVSEPQLTRLIHTAVDLFNEDVQLCEGMATHGLAAISPGETILTICNTGGLATVGEGTAFSVIRRAWQTYKNIQVLACETRPLLQGARLTTWELGKHQIPHRLICDSMAADVMRKGWVQKVLVGADRIAMNGDFANKVGTYSLAVLARHHRIPFFVVAPFTTLSPQTPSGAQIPIEERGAPEILRDWAPAQTQVYNPAFDMTPAELVDGYILDSGLYSAHDVRLGALRDLVGQATFAVHGK